MRVAVQSNFALKWGRDQLTLGTRLRAWLSKAFIFLVALIMLALFAVRLHIIVLPPPYDPFTPPDLREKPNWVTPTKLKVLDFDALSCASALAQAGMASNLLPPTDPAKTCHLQDTVMMSRLSGARLKPEQTRCNIEARLYMWERHLLQPLARQYYGQPVKEITHFGSYSCRTIARSSHMSEHATANAFDISGFVLASGRAISVKRNWNDGGQDAAFLHEARAGLCQYFNLTLSPDYNTDHADHFHVDMGWVRDCR